MDENEKCEIIYLDHYLKKAGRLTLEQRIQRRLDKLIEDLELGLEIEDAERYIREKKGKEKE